MLTIRKIKLQRLRWIDTTGWGEEKGISFVYVYRSLDRGMDWRSGKLWTLVAGDPVYGSSLIGYAGVLCESIAI